MVMRIARKELLEMTRDGRFRVAGGIILLLLLTVLGTRLAQTCGCDQRA